MILHRLTRAARTDLDLKALTIKAAPLLICLAFILFCATQVIGPYQNYNGDFGQYYIHSQNLLQGRDWGFLLENYPAVLPGYPILLSLVSGLFGTGYFYVGLTNVILWAATSYLAFRHFRDRFDHPLTAYAFLIACLTTSYVILFAQDGQPNIFYAFSFILALYATRFAEQISRHRWLANALILLAAWIRIDSVVIYVALLIGFLHKGRRDLLWLPILGIGLTIGLDLLISQQFGMKSNILHFMNESGGAVGETQTLWQSLSSFVDLYIQYVLAFLISVAEVVTPHVWRRETEFLLSAADGLQVRFSLVQIALTGLFLNGFFSVRALFAAEAAHDNLFSLERLLLMGHIAFISLFMTGDIPKRYLLPIVPIYLFFILFGIERLAARIQVNRHLAFGVSTGAVLLLALTNLAVNADHARRANILTLPPVIEMADHLAEIKAERPLAFWKARLLTLLMDRRGQATEQTRGLRQPFQAQDLFASGSDGIAVVDKTVTRFADLNAYLADPANACKTWQNDRFAFYEAPRPGRVCLVE